MPLRTALTDLLGIKHPIIQGGMQYVGYAEMASAVSNAGGLGILTALTQATPDDLRKEIHRCRTMTSKPFGVNLTILPSLISADYDGYARVIAEEKVTLCEIAGGSPAKFVPIFHANGVTKVLHKSATLRHALKAEKSGVDLIEIVGYEASIAGGQPGDEIGLWVALTLALEKIKTVPIVASGASATGRQLAAAIAMGACGITMATRFLATKEAPIHPNIKQALLNADEKSTTIVLSQLSNSTRVFKNAVSERIREIEFDPENHEGLNFDQVASLANGKRTKEMWQNNGNYNDAMWSCAQSVGLINDIPSCQALIDRIVQDAEAQLHLAKRAILDRGRSKL
mmetsp:Transcript_27978/g.42662  ORF Transcript_27978/g.42662 Transcript_27978/m.42662 type:complete len:341 (+) Transcript_27978:110-1132(+)